MTFLLRFRDPELKPRLARLREAMSKDPKRMAFDASMVALLRLLVYTGAEVIEREYGLGKD